MNEQPMQLVPLPVAQELQNLRSEVAELRKLLTPIMADTKWLTIKDAAKKYDVNPSTINRWVQSGQMRAKGAGANRRVQKVD